MMRDLLLYCVCLLGAQGAVAAPSPKPAQGSGVWVTLGTMGGPIANARRSQPANVLLTDAGAVLVDAGDGAAEQLAKAGVALPRVRAVFLSHLHWDHTGGLAAILGLRFQTNVPGKLAIYGPPGTRALVAGLVASMQPGAEAGYGDPNARPTQPGETVNVIELTDGSTTDVSPGLKVSTVQNTHYSFAPGTELDRRFKSYSYRFYLPGRSIVYTGDTGPSPAVERLAKDADVLVSEMMDVEATVANVRRNTPDMDEKALAGLTWHLAHHHLTAEQVGRLAQRSGVGRVVVTHIVPGEIAPAQAAAILKDVRRSYQGPFEIADDLGQF